MAKKNPLRELIRKWPAPPELKQALEIAQIESDRAAAIMSAALLEGVLEKYITSKLKVSDKETLHSLFDDRGPLSDFHSKILIAKAFGVITDGMAVELIRIKNIRNVFAHAAGLVSFETPEIKKAVGEFNMIKVLREGLEGHPPFNQPKYLYLLMVEIMVGLLSLENVWKAAGKWFESYLKRGDAAGSS